MELYSLQGLPHNLPIVRFWLGLGLRSVGQEVQIAVARFRNCTAQLANWSSLQITWNNNNIVYLFTNINDQLEHQQAIMIKAGHNMEAGHSVQAGVTFFIVKEVISFCLTICVMWNFAVESVLWCCPCWSLVKLSVLRWKLLVRRWVNC